MMRVLNRNTIEFLQLALYNFVFMTINKRFGIALVISITLHIAVGLGMFNIFKPGSDVSRMKSQQETESQPSVPSTPLDDGSPRSHSSTEKKMVRVHTVKRGESLWVIAREYKISIEDLMDANGLSQQYVLKAGDQLKIPER